MFFYYGFWNFQEFRESSIKYINAGFRSEYLRVSFKFWTGSKTQFYLSTKSRKYSFQTWVILLRSGLLCSRESSFQMF